MKPLLSIFFIRHIPGVVTPLGNQGGHVCRQGRIETDEFPCAGMHEAQRLGMESLARTKLETIADELLVLRVDSAFANLRTAIALIIEKRMADIIHMDTNLMGTARLQTALHNRHITETLQNLVMSDSMLALVTIRINLETETVIRITADIAGNRTLILLQIAPDDRNILTLNGMPEKLPGEVKLRLIILRDDKKTGSIHVDTMNQHTHTLILASGPWEMPR